MSAAVYNTKNKNKVHKYVIALHFNAYITRNDAYVMLAFIYLFYLHQKKLLVLIILCLELLVFTMIQSLCNIHIPELKMCYGECFRSIYLRNSIAIILQNTNHERYINGNEGSNSRTKDSN